MTVMVTGGAGFIGGCFISLLFEKYPDYRIVCVDCLTYASDIERLEKYFGTSLFSFYEADIADVSAMERVFQQERPDVVVNFAAESSVDRSFSDSVLFYRTNVIGTQVLLELAGKYKVSRFHQISTDEVYGDMPLDSCEKFSEGSALAPMNPYSISKAAAEHTAMAYFKAHGVPLTISRSSNNYGCFQHREKLIPTIIINAATNKKIPIYGTGKNIRDWLNVMDNCRAIDMIIHKGREGDIYNIGGGCEKSNLEVAEIILKILGKDTGLIAFVGDRPIHDLRYALDCTKIHELGWHPGISFEQGIQETIRFYCSRYGFDC